MTRRLGFLCLASLAAASAPLAAQQPVSLGAASKVTIPITEGWTAQLAQQWFEGDATAVGKTLCGVLDCGGAKAAATVAPRRVADRALVSFVARAPNAEKPAVHSLLLHSDGSVTTAPFGINGSSLRHVTLTQDPNLTFATAWTSEKAEMPGVDDATKLVTAWTGALATGLATVAALERAQQDAAQKGLGVRFLLPDTPPSDSLVITATDVRLPHRHAKVSFAIRAATTTISAQALNLRLAQLQSEASWTALRTSPCAIALRTAVANATVRAMRSMGNQLGADSLKRLDSIARATAGTTLAGEGTCAARDVSQAALVERAAREVADVFAPQASTAEGAGSLTNARLQWFELGTAVGYRVGPDGTPNYEVGDGDKVIEKPFEGAITSAVVLVHLPQDPNRKENHWTRVSLFGGATLTPREGAIGGVSMRLWRGLGLQVSRSWLRANVLREAIPTGGEAPTGRAALRSELVGRWTAGLSLKLQ